VGAPVAGGRGDGGEVAAAEQTLGFALDEKYRDFLRYANGWPAFHNAEDLFGTRELLVGVGREKLGHLEQSAVLAAGVDREHVLPIAASRDDMDLFLRRRAVSGSGPARVDARPGPG